MKSKLFFSLTVLISGTVAAFAAGTVNYNPLFYQQQQNTVPIQTDNSSIQDNSVYETRVRMVKYVEDVRKKVISNWVPRKYASSDKMRQNNITAKISISKSGELLQSKIIVSHGNPETNNAALNAIKKSAPFEPLPENYPDDAVTISILFNIKESRI